MPLWGPNDRANNAPKHKILATSDANGSVMYANTTESAFVPNLKTGVVIDGNHGWAIRKEGTGGRAGRITYEPISAGTGRVKGPGILDSIASNRNILYGMAVNETSLDSHSQYRHIVQNARVIVGEGAMKMGIVQPTQGNFDFSQGDELAKFANNTGKVLRGHTMIWHQYQGATWQPDAIAADWQSVMNTHIHAVATRWNPEVWDVVNEAVADDASGWRETDWYNAAGSINYVIQAFEYAREYCPPGTKLAYCDYGTENGSSAGEKRLYVLQLLEELVNRDLIDVFAAQAHLQVFSDGYRFTENGWAKFIQNVKDLGLRLDLTEMDVSFLSERDEATRDAMAAEITELVLTPWLEQEAGTQIVSWGVRNDTSWLNYTAPYSSYTQSPLPWDTDYSPTAINDEMRDLLTNVEATARPTIQLVTNPNFTRATTDWNASNTSAFSYLTNGLDGNGDGGALLTRSASANNNAYTKVSYGTRGKTYTANVRVGISAGNGEFAIARRSAILTSNWVANGALANGDNQLSFTWPNNPSIYPVIIAPSGTAGQTISIDKLLIAETGGTAIPDWVPYYTGRAVDVFENKSWDISSPSSTGTLAAMISDLPTTGIVSTNRPVMDVTGKLGSGFICAMVFQVTANGAAPSGIGSRVIEFNDGTSSNRMILRWNTGNVLQFDNVSGGVSGTSTTGLSGPPINTRVGVVVAIGSSYKKIRTVGTGFSQEVTVTTFTVPTVTKLSPLNRNYDSSGIWPGVVERIDIYYGTPDDDVFYKMVAQISDHINLV
jgi:GH35 family endo-1,4-beta-xylanase